MCAEEGFKHSTVGDPAISPNTHQHNGVRPCEPNGYRLKQFKSCTKRTPASEEDTCDPEFTVLLIKNPQRCEESYEFLEKNSVSHHFYNTVTLKKGS